MTSTGERDLTSVSTTRRSCIVLLSILLRTLAPPPGSLACTTHAEAAPAKRLVKAYRKFVSQKTGRRESPGSERSCSPRSHSLVPPGPRACASSSTNHKVNTDTHKPQVDRSFPTTTEDQQRRQNPFSLGRFRRKREGQGAAGVGRSPNSRRLDDGLI